ncbi:MAG: ABC transporter permease [Planctomycetota bacterium]|jgi:putative ABC transport system permease protein
MRVLDRKLLRDLFKMKGQIIAIVLIIACGVASFATVLTAYRGLKGTRDHYYARFRMADLFAPVKRAPRATVRELERIPGVRRVEARIVFDVTLDLPDLPQPASGRVISVPERRRKILNDLHLARGRWFEGDGTREVIVHERFALEHDLRVGDRLRAIMNNKKESLHVIGIGLSPEFVYLIRGGGEILPDPERFTVLWMSEAYTEAVFDFEDACNDFVAMLDRGAPVEPVVDAFDRHLDRYGAYGAFGRKDQISNRYLSDEIEGLRGSATLTPTIFLGVAAFVLHMLMARLVRTQRTQIALLRAFGYTTWDLVAHYLKIALATGLLGALLGTAVGIWFAFELLKIYREFYFFPVLRFTVDPAVVGGGCAVSLGFATLGAVQAVRGAARLRPAEGLQPEAPPVFGRTLLERAGFLWRRLGFTTRMILRHIARRKVRAAITVGGVGLSASILMLAFYSVDATDELMDFQFRLAERQDIHLVFHEERGRAALHELRRLPGVRQAEPELGVAVRLVHGRRSRRTAITGLDPDHSLLALLNRDLETVPLPRDGLLLSRKLAELLDLEVGDEVEVQVLTGEKRHFRVPVENVTDEYLGVFAYAELGQLSRWIGERSILTGARLAVDAEHATEVGRTLKEVPAVAAVSYKDRTVASFRETLAASQTIMGTVLILFAGIITFGVTYNTARISLAERARELGSMAVLGFTHREVRRVLEGENLILTALALAPGVGLGAFFGFLLSRLYDTDLFRFPFVIRIESVLWTVVIVLGFMLLANLLVRRRVRRLDIVEVLKARE